MRSLADSRCLASLSCGDDDGGIRRGLRLLSLQYRVLLQLLDHRADGRRLVVEAFVLFGNFAC